MEGLVQSKGASLNWSWVSTVIRFGIIKVCKK